MDKLKLEASGTVAVFPVSKTLNFFYGGVSFKFEEFPSFRLFIAAC